MADAWNEAARDGGHHAVVIEIFLTVLYLLLIEQAELSPFAVSKTIDDGAS